MIKLLEKAGYEVMLAKNGKQAIDMIKIHDFDCILRDVQMPFMDTGGSDEEGVSPSYSQIR